MMSSSRREECFGLEEVPRNRESLSRRISQIMQPIPTSQYSHTFMCHANPSPQEHGLQKTVIRNHLAFSLLFTKSLPRLDQKGVAPFQLQEQSHMLQNLKGNARCNFYQKITNVFFDLRSVGKVANIQRSYWRSLQLKLISRRYLHLPSQILRVAQFIS